MIVDLRGGSYVTWTQRHSKYEVSGAGDLVKKLALNLSLPDGAITKGKVTKHGKSKIYNIDILQKHYKITLVAPSCLVAADGGGEDGECDDNSDSQDVDIWNGISDNVSNPLRSPKSDRYC